jgi:hypothetical protein
MVGRSVIAAQVNAAGRVGQGAKIIPEHLPRKEPFVNKIAKLREANIGKSTRFYEQIVPQNRSA